MQLTAACFQLMAEADGQITEKRMRRARLAARQELEPVQTRFGRGTWERAVGSSGTVRAIADIVRQRGGAEAGVTPRSVTDLIDLAVESEIVRKSGAWFSYGEERLGQGRENVRIFLKENADLRQQIEARVLEHYGVTKKAPEAAPPVTDAALAADVDKSNGKTAKAKATAN